MQIRLYVSILLIAYSLSGYSQNQGSLSFLDSTVFEDLTVGGVASMILEKDQIEVQFNNTLTSFWFRTFEFNAENFRRQINQRRITEFNQTLRVQYGFHNEARWDLGVELKYNWFRDDDFSRNSPFKIFSKTTSGGAANYSGISGLGLRVRYKPFEADPKFIVQGTYSFPIGNHGPLSKRLLRADLNQVGLLATYYDNWNASTYYFIQANAGTQFSPERSNNILGVSSFLIKSFWNDLFFIYPGLTYSFAAQKQKSSSSNFATRSHYLYGGLGGQYAIRTDFIMYAFWNIPLILDNGSLYSEIVRGSFTSVSVGIRFILR